MAKAIKTNNVADNLVKREFEKYGPRRILLTDITYVPDVYKRQLAAQTMKDPYVFDFIPFREDMLERDIEQALVRDVTKPVSYTHLDVYKRQGLKLNINATLIRKLLMVHL